MTEAQIRKRIYPSIVTFKGDWRKMVADVKRLGLTDISLFLTGARITERRKIYQALEQTKVKSIPHIHARNDMREEELDLLVKKYKTKAFTLHYQYIKYFHNSKFIKKIFIENNWGRSTIANLGTLKKVGGMCIDLSHLTHAKNIDASGYHTAVEGVKKYKVGCNHISAIRPDGLSWHYAKGTSELNYVSEIPKKYFSKYICIELGNSISQQLRFRNHIAKILAKSWNKK